MFTSVCRSCNCAESPGSPTLSHSTNPRPAWIESNNAVACWTRTGQTAGKPGKTGDRILISACAPLSKEGISGGKKYPVPAFP